ncbi:class I SAM-dependent methyltransferase [Patescibacteria group bacterium]|nr:class I SAM-dependent methyltransferase [Patescibacteria group bacterium]MBU1931763.1 class I SAM-dependent methyltransferase [Patescibacteria group bacterium]
MDQKTSQAIIKQTQANFNMISPHFLETRRFLWQDITAFMPEIRLKTKILDVACGSGRFAQLAKNPNNYVGVDFAKNLLKAAKKNYPQARFFQGGLTTKSVWEKISQAGPFDLVFCIAFLPHLPLPGQHQDILNHIYRVLQPGGQLVLSVWNLWQPRFLIQHLKQIPKKITTGSLSSLWVPYKISDGQQVIRVASRYHYAFFPGQVEKLLKQAGFKLLKKQTQGKNLIFLGQKPEK